MTTILLGPQRFTVTVAPTVRSLDVAGPIAMINAGWEEREPDDAELAGHLDGRGVNLRLYQRAVELLSVDHALRAAVLEHRARHEELRAFYRIRLQSAHDALLAVRHRTSRHGGGASADLAAVLALRDVDDWYTYEVARITRETAAYEAISGSAELARHRAEVAETLAGASAVVMAGGHVGILMEALHLFAVDLPADLPVVAWSAGAMAVCDPIVLFHDFAPHGIAADEVHDRGLGRLSGVIAFPHAKRRIRLDDPERMAALIDRFPNHSLVPLDDGTIVRVATGTSALPAGTRVFAPSGIVTTEGAS
ncbi:MAG: peptidase E [Micrococcales bacterium]|nr:peptidase E [Micrococcales bacterium]